jgi:hypothetical protein
MDSVDLVKNFSAAMKSWESDYESATRSMEYKSSVSHQNEIRNLYKSRLNDIFNKYLTPHAAVKQGGRLTGLFSSSPSLYDQEIFDEPAKNGKKETVLGKQKSGFQADFMYEIHDGKIDAVLSFFNPATKKWKKLKSI